MSAQATARQPIERAFFAFDNGLTDVKSVQDQVALLESLGYDGIGSRPQHATPELIAALDDKGLRMITSYVVLKAGETPPVSLEQHFELIRTHRPVIWLSIHKSEGADDQAAATTIRQVVDLTAKHGLETSLYPHVNLHTDTVKSCERIHPLVKRPELGISFTLCHFLAQNPHEQLEATLHRIAPKLSIVQINGANRLTQPKADWKQLIQPLGQGSFDVGRVMRTLDEIGYSGPINLQCYRVQGPSSQHLAASIEFWKKLNSKP